MCRLYILFVFLILFQNINAQRIEIVDFIADFAADDFGIEEIALRDNNRSAYLFVYTPKMLKFKADLDISRQYKSEYMQLLLLPHGTSNIIISHEGYATLSYDFPEPLESGKMYKMTVSFNDKKRNELKKMTDSQQTERFVVPKQKPTYIKSTDIELSDFRFNPKSLIGSVSPELDNTGQACAVIRYFVNGDDFVVEPNLGVIKSIEKPGEIIQYVPAGTRRLTIKNNNFMPIRDYEIPLEIVSKATYDVTLSLTYNAVKRQKASPEHDNYLGIGYNSSLSFGTDGGKRVFTVHCNGAWEISSPSWCKLSKEAGTGAMDIEVTAKTNSTGNPRRGVIGIQSQEITVTINVEQNR